MLAQCGYYVAGDVGDRLREKERVRVLTRFAHQADGTVNGIAGSRRHLVRLDQQLPLGCPRAAPTRRPYWPLPSENITLMWHQLELWGDGKGKGEHGRRAVSGLKDLRTAMFNEHRESMLENPLAVMSGERRISVVSGSAPSHSVGVELFTRGLETTLGTKSTPADAMPPSVARALERALVEAASATRNAWAKYNAVATRLCVVQGYVLLLRGDEPWKQKWSVFSHQPFLHEPCPRCGHRHALVSVNERVKETDRGFDLVMGLPLSGSGLHTLSAVEDMLKHRAEVEKALRAQGIFSDHLFVKPDGRPWKNKDFWQDRAVPELKRLANLNHPGLVGTSLEGRRATIRMLRRGGDTFYMQAPVRDDLVNMMGRWREKDQRRDPGTMRVRYYGGIRCEDGVKVTLSAPPRSRIGFAAWHSFES